MIPLSKRIKSLVDYSGMSIPEFSRHIGLKSPSAIRELINGRTKTLSDSVGIYITLTYPNINKEWLHKGIGEMFNTTPNRSFNVFQDNNDKSTMFGYVNVVLPEKGKQKILNADGITIETDETDSARYEREIEDLRQIISTKDEVIFMLKEKIESLKRKEK